MLRPSAYLIYRALVEFAISFRELLVYEKL